MEIHFLLFIGLYMGIIMHIWSNAKKALEIDLILGILGALTGDILASILLKNGFHLHLNEQIAILVFISLSIILFGELVFKKPHVKGGEKKWKLQHG